ncbi:peptidase M20 [candidate division KSB3 bacterium]|uniref:Peptidase M20 n=1 Tax=candidate division KSB3 bacterium TaxID=2044937 RepID=A0A2G6KIW0_9BACT|nr:MAG: peptidase M20 [candidate division KSB3 bacterium]
MQHIIHYLRDHREKHLDELFQLVRIPSVSTLPEHAGDVMKCAEFLAEHFTTLGMNAVKIMPTGKHPVVYGEWLELPDAPTILIYGHYDVQPPEPLELWDSPPFEPEIRDGQIYARGIADDKGLFFAYVKAIEGFFTQDGVLPVNIKLLIEGEEEIGSENLHTFVQEHAELLKADAIVLSDNSMFAPGVPTICCGTRGLVSLQIDLESAARDLHSGGFGGLAENPIQVLADMLSALKDKNERVTIPGYYDDVAELTESERQNFAALPFDEDAEKASVGISEFVGEKGFTLLERRWTRPTLDVNGILGGFTGEGVKTIIPAKAMAKITLRLVPNQDPNKIARAAEKYITSLAPSSVTCSVHAEVGGKAYVTPIDHPILAHVSEGIRKTYDRKPVFSRTGGTIGVLSTFADVLQVPIAMVGFSNPDDNIHAPNEHLTEEAFYTGCEVAAHVLNELKLWKPESSETQGE